MGYKFEEGKHIHTLDGKPLMGVTTVLSVISKPALIQWSASEAVNHIENNSVSLKDFILKIETKPKVEIANPDVIGDDLRVVSDETLKEARTAHRKKKEKAGDWGTAVHLAVEEWIKEQKEPTNLDEKGMEAFNNFKNWATENKVEFLESERHIWSKELWIGGIVDLVFKMDGKKYIGDIKTSSGIYNEAFFQMGAYHLCLDEMGEAKDVEGYIVINLKKDGKMDLKMATDMEMNQNAFKYALGLYKIINSLKK